MISAGDDSTAPVVVLGLGNILLGDEGLGVRAIERLRDEYKVPADVEIADGGTAGIDLIPYLRKDTTLIIVDAVKIDGPPGTLLRLVDAEIPAFLAAKLSPHQIGLPDVLATAGLLDRSPKRIVLLGMKPKSLETGIELSAEITAKLDELVQAIRRELEELGYPVSRVG